MNMKRFVPLLAIVLVCSLFSFAQNSPTTMPQFTLNFHVLNGPSGTVGTDIGATYAVTANFWLRADNLVIHASPGNYFGIGGQYSIPQVCDLLSKTNLNCEKFQPYVTGSIGETRIADTSTSTAVNHTGGMVGFGSNYDPTGTGKFTVNLFDVHFARLPGMAKGVTPIVSLGINLGWGTNQAAAPAAMARHVKRMAKERRRMEKLQKAAAAKS